MVQYVPLTERVVKARLWANQDDLQSARMEKDLEGKPVVILVLKERSAARVRDLTFQKHREIGGHSHQRGASCHSDNQGPSD